MDAATSDPPWGWNGNYWRWVDAKAVSDHDCPYCGQPKGTKCVTVKTISGQPDLIGSYPLSHPHAGRIAPVEVEAREWRLGSRG